ncbi:ammonium transporter [Novosphingobium sp.]|uniref:ammonium transporter n=1 Tax=Novosphingobium sp. TaxID=1874826 RepID=UPI00333FDB7C
MNRIFTRKLVRFALALGCAIAPALAHAQIDAADAADAVDSGDTAFVLCLALLALAMLLPGIILHHGARLGARAFAALATETVGIAAVVSLLWVLVGYTLAFGTVGSGWLGGGNAWMLLDLANVREGSAVPEMAFVALQLAYAVLAAGLLTGAWAERGNLAWVLPFAGLWILIVYAPLAHWIWGGGWLAARLGTVDAAGALVVHASAGISALVITLLMGRRARFGAQPDAVATSGTAPGLALAGTGMMWIALLALSAAATLAASDDAATTLINGLVAAASGALVWLLIAAVTTGKANPRALSAGAMAGLVAASAGMGAFAPGAAMLAGLIGALVAWVAARMIRAAAIDDAADLVAVHGVAGLAGAMLAAPLIAGTLGGTGYAAGMGPVRQVLAQALGAGVVVAWSAIGTAIAALMVAMVVPMRINEADEIDEPDFD